MERKVLA